MLEPANPRDLGLKEGGKCGIQFWRATLVDAGREITRIDSFPDLGPSQVLASIKH